MLAYHGDAAIKAEYLDRLAQHRAADQLLQSYGYWKDGKGCAVGCTIHSSDHADYERLLGIPQMLARLEDAIFEGLSVGAAQLWPERFLSAIHPGQDLSCVGWQLLHWLLTDPPANPGITHPIVAGAVRQCALVIEPLTRGEAVAESAAESAERSAERAARSAWSAWSARSAARSAESAAESARSAAWSARSAESAAESAVSAAWSAVSAAWSARSAARSAERAARSAERAAWEKIADKLIELIGAT